MDEFLAHPAVQAGVAPFIAALAVAAALGRTRLLGLATVAAFAAVIGLTIGFSYETLTALRKLELVGLACAGVVLAAEFGGASCSARVRLALDLAVAACAVWLVWRVLQQQPMFKATLQGLASVAFVVALMESSLALREEKLRVATSSLALGLAVGVLSVLGASVVLGQIGIALAAGSGAVLLVQLLWAQPSASGWTVALPTTVVAGLGALLAVFTASLPWFCLVPLLVIPWATRLVAQQPAHPWLTAVLSLLAALVPAVLAATLAWFAAGAAA